MKLNTLNYIHNLLIEREKATETAMHMTYKAYCEADDKNADNAEYLHEAYKRARELWLEAQEAKEDFESKEW